VIGKARPAAILSAAWIALTAGTPSSSSGQDALLPPTVGEWRRSDSVGVYAGKDLFLLIDGGADLFFEYGFVRAFSSEYSRMPDRSVTTELYEMSSPPAAYGLFTSFTVGTGTAVSVGQEAVLGEGYCIFWKGPYVGMLTDASADSASGPMLLQLAEGLATEIRHTGALPNLCAFLREGGVDSRSMVFFRGKLALGSQLPHAWADPFPPADGVVGESGASRYLILEYTDATTAGAALRAAAVAWEELQLPVSRDTGGTWRVQLGKEEIAVLEQLGQYVLGVTVGRDKSDVLASRLKRILENQ